MRLGWSHGDQEIFTQQELIDYFSLEQVGKKGAIFDTTKLGWVNSIYLREKEPGALRTIIIDDVEPALLDKLTTWNTDHIDTVIALYQERVTTLQELAHNLITLHNGPQTWDQADVAKWVGPDTRAHMEALCQMLELVDGFTVDIVAETVKKCAKQRGVKLVTIAQPIRIALIGSSSGPGVFVLMGAVGKMQTLQRIQALLHGIP